MLKARAFAIEANLPHNFWPQLVVTVGYIMNRTPSLKLQWMSPFECVYGYKPLVSHLDIIGSKVYVLKKNIPKLDRLTSRAHIGYLVGWESTNIYKIWIPSLSRIVNSRDVLIDSGNLYDLHDIDAFVLNELPEEEILRAIEWQSTFEENYLPADSTLEDFSTIPLRIDTRSDYLTGSKSETQLKSNLVKDGERDLPKAKGNRAILASLINPDLNEGNTISSRTRKGGKRAGNFAYQYYLSFSTASISSKKLTWHREELPDAPKGWEQMLKHKFSNEFQKAANKEYETLESKGTWTLVDRIKDEN